MIIANRFLFHKAFVYQELPQDDQNISPFSITAIYRFPAENCTNHCTNLTWKYMNLVKATGILNVLHSPAFNVFPCSLR